MTKLLVSVRNLAEARMLLDASGVDLVDVKEPDRGSLGRAEPAVVRAVVSEVAGRLPVSVACGELVDTDWDSDGYSTAEYATALPDTVGGVEYFKFGLAGAARLPDWAERWATAIEAIGRLPTADTPRAVAVVYADWKDVDAPCPQDIVEIGASLGCGAALLDTCRKTDGTLTDLWTDDRIASFIRHTQRHNLLAVVGGSLTVDTIPQVVRLGADVVAVRGAACRVDRKSGIDSRRIRQLVACLRDCRSKPAPV